MKYSKPLSAMLNNLMKQSPENDRTRPVAGELFNLTLPVEGIERIAATRNPMETEAAHAKKVAQAAEKVRQSVQRTRDKIEALSASSLAAIEGDITTRTRLQPTAQAAEIRAILRQMKQPDRLAAITKAIDSKDFATLAAIADGNELTTGLDDEARNRMLDSYRMRVAPDLFNERERLLEIRRHVPQMVELAMTAATEATDPAFIAEITELEAKAKAAEADFAQSLT
jgi:hypothetical protein